MALLVFRRVNGQATEVNRRRPLLPMASPTGSAASTMPPSAGAQSLLLVDASAFSHSWRPVVKAAGYRFGVAPNAQEGLLALRFRVELDVVLDRTLECRT